MAALPRTKAPSPVFRIEPQARAVFEGRAVTIMATPSADQVAVRVDGTNALHMVAIEDLAPLCAESPAALSVAHVSVADPEAEARALAWNRALSRLPRSGLASFAARQAVAQEMGASIRTVSRRYQRYLANPVPGAQLNSRHGLKLGSRRLRAVVECIIDQAINEVYLTRERRPISAVERRVRELCVGARLHCPCRGTIRVRIDARNQLFIAKRRLGPHEGAAAQAPSIKGLRVSAALEVVQIDHACVDLIVVSPTSRQVLGRPWITLAIDVHTRCVLGYHLSFERPSQVSVGLCLEHACFPKQRWISSLDVDVQYPMFGKMRKVSWDNAKEFQAHAVQIQCQRYGIGCVPRPIKQPHYGAYIERYIGTFMGAMHMLRGTTFANPKVRGSYDAEKQAVFSMADLHRWVALQIAGTYHHSPHRGLGGRTPAEAWVAAWRRSDGSVQIPPLISDRREFLLGFLPFVYRAITREGIALYHLRYWDPALTPFINDGKRHRVHYNKNNLAQVYLEVGECYLDIPLLDRAQAAFTYTELKDAKAVIAMRHDAKGSEAELFAAMSQQREIEDVAAHISKKARRKQALRPKQPQTRAAPVVDYTQPVVPIDPDAANVP